MNFKTIPQAIDRMAKAKDVPSNHLSYKIEGGGYPSITAAATPVRSPPVIYHGKCQHVSRYYIISMKAIVAIHHYCVWLFKNTPHLVVAHS
jgi:hypothetical protein